MLSIFLVTLRVKRTGIQDCRVLGRAELCADPATPNTAVTSSRPHRPVGGVGHPRYKASTSRSLPWSCSPVGRGLACRKGACRPLTWDPGK